MGGCLVRLARDERGATAIEYGLIAALIAVVALGSFALVGDEVNQMYDYIKTEILKALGG